jgi:hypothetical protein
MKFYKRLLQAKIEYWLFKNKIIIISGARQVGKTTLAKNIIKKYSHKKSIYYNCEDPLVIENIVGKSASFLFSFFEKSEIIVLDEAHHIPSLGKTLKIFHDAYPKTQVIITESSSFNLISQTGESLAGRSLEFNLYPLSLQEISKDVPLLEKKALIQEKILFGMYPEIIKSSIKDKKILLNDLCKKYLLQDILQYEGIKNSTLIYKLTKALAYQIGSEISVLELSNLLNSSQHTIEKYLDILEKAFVIISLPSFSTNQRKEIRKGKKIYFYDTGIRNALIQSFEPLDLRNDKGALLENMFLLEHIKHNEYNEQNAEFFFWRTYDQQEIDFLKKTDNKIEAFEIKWSENKKKKSPPVFFAKTYKKAIFKSFSLNDLV